MAGDTVIPANERGLGNLTFKAADQSEQDDIGSFDLSTPVSLGQGGCGLGTMWGVEMAQVLLESAGFGEMAMHRLEHDPVNAYFIARP
ncbi:MAG: hypothetical protein ABW080_04635 [Candidatus Thiodiazotropha sp.]